MLSVLLSCVDMSELTREESKINVRRALRCAETVYRHFSGYIALPRRIQHGASKIQDEQHKLGCQTVIHLGALT